MTTEDIRRYARISRKKVIDAMDADEFPWWPEGRQRRALRVDVEAWLRSRQCSPGQEPTIRLGPLQ